MPDSREQPLAARYRALLEVSASAAADREPATLIGELPGRLRSVTRFDCLVLALHDSARNTMRLFLLDGADPRPSVPQLETHAEEGPGWVVWQTQRPWVHPEISNEHRFPRVLDLLRDQGVRSVCAVPLTAGGRRLGVVMFGSRAPYSYPETEVDFLGLAATHVAAALDHALVYRHMVELNDRLERERRYLEEEIGAEYAGPVGESDAWKRVLRDLETVATPDATVLIRGEAGTGKELVARAIHNLSRRRGRAFVAVRCGSVPVRSLEAELFGEERELAPPRIGRLELADGGTVFLDEVGDIPLALQPKLLRVLQEREFERLGGTRTMRVDVRLVAATSRDLARLVAGGEFRSDLFYRVSVFPVSLPPLREREGDIPLLVRHFARRFARVMNRPAPEAAPEDLWALSRRPWTGNVRELANLVERAVMLSDGHRLHFPPGELRTAAESGEPLGTMHDAERRHIIRALRESRWIVGGPNGAAARLGMKRTTLQSRMQKLGISRQLAATAE